MHGYLSANTGHNAMYMHMHMQMYPGSGCLAAVLIPVRQLPIPHPPPPHTPAPLEHNSLLLLPLGWDEPPLGFRCVEQGRGVNVSTVVIQVGFIRVDL